MGALAVPFWLARVTPSPAHAFLAGPPPSQPVARAGSTSARPAAFESFQWAVTVTAYCPCEECCGEWAHAPMGERVMASGEPLAPYIEFGQRFCAAPPEVPFGTMIEIPGYGTVPVLDRGGAIKHNRLDVFFPTHAAALEWGVKELIVTVFIDQNEPLLTGGE